jgi:hypothetical protein
MKIIALFVALFFITISKTNAFTTRIPYIKYDSIPVKKKLDSTHSPKIALKKSLLIPGWGQVYNKQYWKVPIIYTALGITGFIFFDNLKTYNDIRFAYNARYKARLFNDQTDIPKIKPYLSQLDESGLALNRRKFRQQIDYSVLFFLAFWGLNVADAVVFAHLKNFDVSDNLSGYIALGNNPVSQNTGIRLSLNLKQKTKKLKLFK